MAPVLLDVPFADVTPEQLRVSLNGEVPHMLASTVVSHVRAEVIPPLTLGILGSSHVVFVGKREHPEFVEEVSCTARGGQPLLGRPAELESTQARSVVSGPDVSVEKHSSVENLAARVAGIKREVELARLRADAGGVCAAFPGSDLAITALIAQRSEAGYEWTTWHVYPPSAVVTTRNTWEARSHG